MVDGGIIVKFRCRGTDYPAKSIEFHDIHSEVEEHRKAPQSEHLERAERKSNIKDIKDETVFRRSLGVYQWTRDS
jgi:hypothetical protein